MAEDRDIKEINIKNSDTIISELKLESIRLAGFTSSAYLELDKAKKDLAKFLVGIGATKKQEIDELNSILNDKEKAKLDCSNKEREIANYTESVKQFLDDKKESQKELNKLNSWTLKAKEDWEALDLKNKDFDIIISRKEKDVDSVLSLENEIKELERTRDLLKLDNDSLIQEGRHQLDLLREDADGVSKDIENLKKDAEFAEIKRTQINNESTRQIQDLIEYTDRIRLAWDQVFPDINMPLLPHTIL